MSIGDILQDILVELLNATWLSIITFTDYNCFSLFMAILGDCYSSSTAAGELFAMCSPSSQPADAACGPAERREHLPQSKRNSLETFSRCRYPLAAHPVPPSTCPPLPGIPWTRDHSPGSIAREESTVSGKHKGQEQSWNYCVISSFAM